MSKALILYNNQVQTTRNPLVVAVDRFLAEVRRDLSESTYRTYSAKIKIFKTYINSFGDGLAHAELLKTFKSSLREGDYSPATINLTLSVVRSFYKSLLERGVLDRDYSHVIKNVKDTKEIKRLILSKVQIEEIIATLGEDRSINAPRNRCLMILLASTGMRINEAANICMGDFGMHNGRRIINLLRKGYSDKNNHVYIKEDVYQLLMELAGDRTSDDDALFISYRSKAAMSSGELSRIVKTIFRRSGIDDPKITAHSMRSSYAIMALTHGASLMALSRSMNHQNISTTQGYLREFERSADPAELKVNLNF